MSGLHGTKLTVMQRVQIATCVCTEFTIVEDSGESTLDSSHRAMHDATADLVQSIVQEQGFMMDL